MGELTDTVTQTATNQMFTENGAKINRVNDRLFIGEATANMGTAKTNEGDWLTDYQLSTGRSNGFIQFAQSAVLTNLNPASCNAIVAGARTSTLKENGNSIPAVAVGINDNCLNNTNTYAFYGEAYNTSGTKGGAYGMELDTVNYNKTKQIDPYQQQANKVIGLQICSGAELASHNQYPGSAAINIRNNGSTFDKGIVFGSDVISGANGVEGTGVAIALGKGHQFSWYNSMGNICGTIGCYTQDPAHNQSISFTDSGLEICDRGNGLIGVFQNSLGTNSNYLVFSGSPSGSAVAELRAEGRDTNTSLNVSSQGTGSVYLKTGGGIAFEAAHSGVNTTSWITIGGSNGGVPAITTRGAMADLSLSPTSGYVRIGNWKASGYTNVNGYISVKDSNGVVRKLVTME